MQVFGVVGMCYGYEKFHDMGYNNNYDNCVPGEGE